MHIVADDFTSGAVDQLGQGRMWYRAAVGRGRIGNDRPFVLVLMERLGKPWQAYEGIQPRAEPETISREYGPSRSILQSLFSAYRLNSSKIRLFEKLLTYSICM